MRQLEKALKYNSTKDNQVKLSLFFANTTLALDNNGSVL